MPTPARNVTVDGIARPIASWAARTGVPVQTIRSRIDKLGWSPERAVSVPPDRRFKKGGRHPAGAARPVPKLRKKAGRAVVRWQAHGRNFCRSFGRWGSAEANANYARFAAGWAAGGVPAPVPVDGATVAAVCLAFMTHAAAEYMKLGKRTSEYHLCGSALRVANRLYGTTPAADFGPPQLRACRDVWLGEGKARKTVNGYAGRLVRAFGWAAGQGLVPASVPAALREVEAVKAGRTAAPEPKARGVVADDAVERTLAALPGTRRGRLVAVMVPVQRLLGCRPQHLTGMRAGDLDRSQDPWVYTPPDVANKTFHRGKAVRFFVGPKAQALLAPLLVKLEPADRVFPVSRDGYALAVRLAARKAGQPHWSPHQLRHAHATAVAVETGSVADAAAAIGDTPETAARHYVHTDPAERTRRDLAARFG